MKCTANYQTSEKNMDGLGKYFKNLFIWNSFWNFYTITKILEYSTDYIFEVRTDHTDLQLVFLIVRYTKISLIQSKITLAAWNLPIELYIILIKIQHIISTIEILNKSPWITKIIERVRNQNCWFYLQHSKSQIYCSKVESVKSIFHHSSQLTTC